MSKIPNKDNNNTSWQKIKFKPSDNNYDNIVISDLKTNLNLNNNNANNTYKDE